MQCCARELESVRSRFTFTLSRVPAHLDWSDRDADGGRVTFRGTYVSGSTRARGCCAQRRTSLQGNRRSHVRKDARRADTRTESDILATALALPCPTLRATRQGSHESGHLGDAEPADACLSLRASQIHQAAAHVARSPAVGYFLTSPYFLCRLSNPSVKAHTNAPSAKAPA
jgi:hypothetical protein